MSINSYFDTSVDIYRLTANTDESPEDIEEYTLWQENVVCNIQPLDDSYGEDFSGTHGKDFLMFCQQAGIKEYDKIKQDGIEYRVVGVEEYDLKGRFHSEVRIRRL